MVIVSGLILRIIALRRLFIYLVELHLDGQADDGCTTACLESPLRQQTISSADGTVSARPTVPSR